MNSIDFLKELNEIDDDLLMNAELPPKRKASIPFYSMGIKAAVIALLFCLIPATVIAVTIGVRILVSQEEIPNYGDYMLGGIVSVESKVTTIEYELSPQRIEVPLQWEEKLTDAWKGFPYSYDNFTGIDLKNTQGSRINLGGITEIETLLGTTLTTSDELEQVTQGAYVSLIVTDQERAAAQLRSEGIVSPDGILIYLPFRNDKETGLGPEVVDYCGLKVFIPLTEYFAHQYAEHCVMSSVNQQDLAQSSFFSSGNIEVILLQNRWQDEWDATRGYAVWAQSGIGYLVELKCSADVKTSPGELLRPYLENLEG